MLYLVEVDIYSWSQVSLIASEEKIIGLPKQGFAPKKVKLPRSSLKKMPKTYGQAVLY